MRGYRGDNFTQIETLGSWRSTSAPRGHVRNLEAKVTEPILKGLLGRIAADEERHEEFFHNLVAHCMEHHRESTIAAIARRGSSLGPVGGDIIEYQDKLKVVADAGYSISTTRARWSPTGSRRGVPTTSRCSRNSSSDLRMTRRAGTAGSGRME